MIVLGDVHLGHRKVRSKKIIAVLDEILHPDRLKNISVVVINGDLFDRQLAYDSDDAWVITRWIERFLRASKKAGVIVRILLGTPSHDCRQSQWIPLLNEAFEINADVRYYDKVTVEPLCDNGPLALWVPDEVNYDASKTWNQVVEVLREYGTETVDFSFMHGMFRFQEPIRTISSHSEDRYESITKHRIVINHHHTHVSNGKIVAPGSPDRLRMNEEEDKGHYQCSLINDEIVDEYFIVNDKATVFSTINVEGLSFNQTLEKLKQYADLEEGSNLRLAMTREDDAFISFNKIANVYPQFKFTHKLLDIDTGPVSSSAIIERQSMTSIRPDTIRKLLEPRLEGVPADVMQEIDEILTAIES